MIAAFAINLLRVAEDSFFLSPRDRRGLLVKRLTYGDMPPDKAEEIVKLSSGLALAYAQEALPIEDRKKHPTGPIDLTCLPAPEYAPEVAEVLERVVASPMMYWDAIRLLDALLFGHLVLGRPVQRGDLPRPECGVEPGDAYKAAKNIIALVCDAAGVDRRPFWPDRISPPPAPSEVEPVKAGGSVAQAPIAEKESPTGEAAK